MDVFKTLLWDSIVKASIARLFIVIPWLGYGPLGIAVSIIITKFTDVMYHGLKLSIQLDRVVVLNDELRLAYNNSAVLLHVIAKDKGIDSNEFKNARIEHQKALSNFVRFDIARV